jgi:hypothetical protein
MNAVNPFARWREQPDRFIEEYLVNTETDEAFKLLSAERTFLAH